MSIRGSITIECDRSSCHAEIVLEADDATIRESNRGMAVELNAAGWHTDEDGGDIWCPECLAAAERRADGPQDDGQSYADPRDALAERLED